MARQQALASAATAQQRDSAEELATLETSLADNRARWQTHALFAAATAGADPGDWLLQHQRSCEARQRELDTMEQARHNAAALRDAAQRETPDDVERTDPGGRRRLGRADRADEGG